MVDQTRRSVLGAAGAIGLVSLAGCVTGDGNDPPTSTDGNDTYTDTDGTDVDSVDDQDDDPADDENENDLEHLPGESVDDFENLDKWFAFVGQGTLEATADDVYGGTQSAHMHAEEDIEWAGIYREFSEPLDLSGKNLSLAIKFTGRDLLDLRVQIIAPNTNNLLNLRRTLTGPADRWMRVDLGANFQETQPDLFDVREIRVTARRRGGEGGPIDVSVDDLRAVDRPDTGYVMLLFDGTLEAHHETAFDIMQEYEFAGVESVIPEAVDNDGRLSLQQMREMRDAGWDMIARPRVGGQFMHEFSREEQEGMIRRTQTYLRNRGFEDGAKHFFTPRNVIGPEGMDLVREYHEQAFRFGGAPNGLALTDPHNLGHFSAANGGDTKAFIELAAQYDQLAIPRFGDVGGDGMSEDAFRDLLDHIDEADVQVITATDLLAV